ncbi:protein LEO1-like protein [Iris pallida]|uniref:Protein LEO1-like protein n=1 Tax=Iris pallida TaxID=29817 RepID=A0AAX6IJJ8_IRIPA|nr:protein LEO1-like protein [Iris pallida]
MTGEREIEEETRNQMMQKLFGEQSEEEEEEEEVDSEHDAATNHSDYQSDEGGGEADIEGEGEGEAEGQGEVEVESEGEAHNVDHEQGESEGERVQSSPEREGSYQQEESEGKEAKSEEGYEQRVVTSRRRGVIASDSEGSEDNQYAGHENEDEEIDQARKPSRPMDDLKDDEAVRKVFGDSDDDDEQAEYSAQNELEHDSHRSQLEDDGGYEKDLREDVVPDEDAQFESEDERFEHKPKEKPVGPPLELEVPLRRPPGHPDRMNLIRVSNIMGIEPKPFDPKTFVEEDVFVTDESGTKKRIRLEDNIVRWRTVKNRDGTTSIESNARFVKWSDGSMQLLIGNEVLDINVQEAHHDQTHLFLRHGKGILQSQGRLLRKMRFMPSSLSSKSHRLLTALVDSRHKKVYKVKNCITDIDPEREKEEKEKVEGQTIRANELLNRKREKVNRKYAPTSSHRGRQLSPGFLEDALEEEDEPDDDYSDRRGSSRNRFEEDMEAEAQRERRIINAKKSNIYKNAPRKPSLPAVRPSKRPVEKYSESEREESEYETDGEDIERSPSRGMEDEPDHEDEYEDEDAEEEVAGADSMSEEEEEPKQNKGSGGSSLKRKEIQSDEDSPPRKTTIHRRKAVVFDSDED